MGDGIYISARSVQSKSQFPKIVGSGRLNCLFATFARGQRSFPTCRAPVSNASMSRRMGKRLDPRQYLWDTAARSLFPESREMRDRSNDVRLPLILPVPVWTNPRAAAEREEDAAFAAGHDAVALGEPSLFRAAGGVRGRARTFRPHDIPHLWLVKQ